MKALSGYSTCTKGLSNSHRWLNPRTTLGEGRQNLVEAHTLAVVSKTSDCRNPWIQVWPRGISRLISSRKDNSKLDKFE